MNTEKIFPAIAIIIIIGIGVWVWKSFYNKPIVEDQPENTVPSIIQQVVSQGLLKIEDLKIGNGKEANLGSTLTVHYLGTLLDGIKFDSSYDHGQSFNFQLGANQVIPGWELGTFGMKEGGKRKLTIAPSLGYGDQAVGKIPANSTLVFEIDLLEVKE